jgi:branched-chain amino acid transport system ATP-binding protein
VAAEVSLLRTEGLTRRFGALVVTNELSLQVAAGEIYGVIGPNGAGKSSLIRLINGQLRPDAGRILLAGRDVTALAPAARCRAGIATAFQIPQPFGAMSVYENLLVAAAYGGGRREADCHGHCAELLRRTGLRARANDAAAALNLLDRKRLELARALASGPKLLLLDEVAGGLTDEEIPALLDIIRPLRTEGVTVLWIEHVVHALFALIDRLLVIDFGARVAEGDPREVFASAQVQRIYLGIEAVHAA